MIKLKYCIEFHAINNRNSSLKHPKIYVAATKDKLKTITDYKNILISTISLPNFISPIVLFK